jgi:hypothetical protein
MADDSVDGLYMLCSRLFSVKRMTTMKVNNIPPPMATLMERLKLRRRTLRIFISMVS